MQNAATKLFDCALCGRYFSSPRNMRKHEQIHAGLRNHRCFKCSKSFSRYDSIRTHQRTVHDGEKRFECDNCGQRFSKRCNMQTHEACHAATRIHRCPLCAKRFLRAADVGVHRRRVHEILHRFECDNCGQRFSRRCNLQTHEARHAATRTHRCQLCATRFFCQAAAGQHYRRVHEILHHFECGLCGVRIRGSNSFSRHIARHRGKSYPCTLCGERFSRQCVVALHRQSVHERLRPFACLRCAATFAHKGNLQNHRRIHSGERPFACQHCGCKFRQRPNLYQHIARMHAKQRLVK